MPTVLITGANRGIGAGLADRFARAGWQVIGTARRPEAAPPAQGPAVGLKQLDVTDPESVRALAGGLAGQPIDLLVNNAGIYGPRGNPLGDLDYHAWAEVLETNLFGPVRVAEALLPNLRAGQRRQIATISSRMGSIGSNKSGGSYAYRSAKAAVNAAMKSISLDLAGEGFTVVVLHPGWVRTDMGGREADLPTEASVAGLVQVLDRLTTADNGRFLNYDGTPLPW